MWDSDLKITISLFILKILHANIFGKFLKLQILPDVLEVHTLTTTVVIRTLGKQIHCEVILDYIELEWCQQRWGFFWSWSFHRKLLCPNSRHSMDSFLKFIFMALVGIYSHPHWNYSKTKILLALPRGGSITHLFKCWNKLKFIFRENFGLLLRTFSAHTPVELKGPPTQTYANSQF